MKTKLFLLFTFISLFGGIHKAYGCFTLDYKFIYSPDEEIPGSLQSNHRKVWFIWAGQGRRIQVNYTIDLPTTTGYSWFFIYDLPSTVESPYALLPYGQSDTDPSIIFKSFGGYSKGTTTTSATSSGWCVVVLHVSNPGNSGAYSGISFNYSTILDSTIVTNSNITVMGNQSVMDKLGIGTETPMVPLHVKTLPINSYKAVSRYEGDITNWGNRTLYFDSFLGQIENNPVYIQGATFDNTDVTPQILSSWIKQDPLEKSVSFGNEGQTFFKAKASLQSEAVDAPGDILIGTDDYSRTIGEGYRLNFLGISENYRPMHMSRYNISNEISELRVNLGHYTSSSNFSPDNGRFVIGYGSRYASAATWYPQFIVTGSGNVGIGTGDSIPVEKLEVRGNIKADTLKAANLQLSGNVGIGTGDTIPVEKLEVRGNIKADTLKAANLRLSGNANFATIRTTGNVGIGTGDSIPVEKLEIWGNIKADTLKAANLQLDGNNSLGLDTIKAKDIRIDNVLGVVNDGIIVPDNSASTLPLYIYKHVNLLEEENSSNCIVTFSGKSTSAIKNSLWLRRDVTGSGGWGTARLHNGISVDGSYLQPGVDTRTWWERDPQDVIQSWGHADLTYMTLKGDKLGIGTENPTEKLDINGKVKASGLQILSGNTAGLTTNSIGQKLLLYTNSANETASVYVNSNTTQSGTGGGSDDGLLVGIRAGGIGTVWHRSAQPLTFGTSGMERMRILANGNIGIGTVDPQYSLDVKGIIRTTEVLIESIDKFPDYVFDDSYKLLELESLDNFIKTNRHLPEMPTAEEVKENGVGLVDMQLKLLQKVEELTLYILMQNEKIKTLEESLNNTIK